jgi:transcriptional regulator with XRE-family HTH domain
VQDKAGRRCVACGGALSRYNGTSLCGPCSRSPSLPPAGDLWSSAQVRSALAAWDAGTVVLLYRRCTGVTQGRVAAAVGFDQSEVSRLERGGKKVRDREHLLAWLRPLGLPEDLVPVAPSALHLAAAAGTGETGFRALRSESVLDAWMVSPSLVPGGFGGTGLPVDEQDLLVAEETLGMFRQLDHAHGAGHFTGHLVSYIDTDLADLLARPAGSSVGAVRSGLAARFLELAGYQLVDSGAPGLAQEMYQRALAAAVASGDPAYGGYLVAASLGHLALHCGDPETALAWARRAESVLGTSASPATRAAVTAVSARALARMGREAETTQLLLACEKLLDRSDAGDEPRWIAYFNRAYLADEVAHCLHDLGRAPAARSAAEDALDGVGASRVRRLAIDATLLASAWLRSGDVEQACVAARDGVRYTAKTSSGRCRERIRQLLADLAPNRDVPCVRDLENLVCEVLPDAFVIPW